MSREARIPWPVLVLGLLLQMPAFFWGFFADDYGHRMVFTKLGEDMPMRWWSLFDFGSREDWRVFEEQHGSLPWWTSEDWRIRFFRPLSSASLALDHWIFGDFAAGHHLTSLLLYGALLVALHRLFLALSFSPGAARLGLLFFALSHATVIPVQWIANRNALLEALMIALALLVLHRGPATPLRIVGALGCALAACASKESGVVALALVAVSLLLRMRSSKLPQERRIAFFGSCAAVLLGFGYVAALASAGFGTKSLFYATPWLDPRQFGAHLGLLSTAGLLSLLGPFTLDTIAPIREAWLPAALLRGAVGGCAMAWIATTVRGRSGIALLWCILVLTLLPQGGVLPSDRLLFVPAMAASGLVAQFFEARARALHTSRISRWTARALFISLTLGSGVLLAIQSGVMVAMSRHVRETAAVTDVGPRELGQRVAIVLQTESALQGFTLGTTWLGTQKDPDVRFVLVQTGPRGLRWTRTGERSFELESLDGPFLNTPFERVYLSREPDFVPGRTWSCWPLEIQAHQIDYGHPRILRIVSEVPLDSPATRFLRPVQGVLTHLPPPAIGETIEIPRAVATLPFLP